MNTPIIPEALKFLNIDGNFETFPNGSHGLLRLVGGIAICDHYGFEVEPVGKEYEITLNYDTSGRGVKLLARNQDDALTILTAYIAGHDGHETAETLF